MSLLEKVRSRVTLSKAELAELATFEKAGTPSLPDIPDAEIPPSPMPAGKIKVKKGRRRLISALRLRRLGYACDDLAEADHVVALRRPLSDVIAGDAELEAAWRRGQFLRRLMEAACRLPSISQAASYIGIKGGGMQLRRILDSDPEAQNIWDQHYRKTEMAVRSAIIELAKSGNLQAIKTVGEWVRDQRSQPGSAGADLSRVTMTQLADLFGVSRQTIYVWTTERDLSRNSDGTFDLSEVIAWFEKYVEARASRGIQATDIDPMRTVKMRKLELDLDEQMRRLLPREPVITGLVARFKLLSNSLAKLPRETAMLLENQPLVRIRETLEATRLEILNEQKQIPAELELDEGPAASLRECLEQLT